MVLCLKLHSSHHNQPEKVCFLVVPAGHNLVVNEAVVDFSIISMFVFMISDQHKGSIEPTNEISQQEVGEVLIVVEENDVVDGDGDELNLSYKKVSYDVKVFES